MKKTHLQLFTGSILLSSLLLTGCGGSGDAQNNSSSLQPHKTNRTATDLTPNIDQWNKYVSISSTYDKSIANDHKLSFDILFEQGISSDAKHFQVYIDTDYNSNTGWSYGDGDCATIGADYMIEDGSLFKSTSDTDWNWSYVDKFDYQAVEEANNMFRIKMIGNSSKIMSITDLDRVQNMNISIESVDANWNDTHNFVTSQDIKIKIIGENTNVDPNPVNPIHPGQIDPDPVSPDPIEPIPNETIYENAEDGLNPNWITILGQYTAERRTPGYKNNSKGFVKLRPEWIDKGNGLWDNKSEYHLYMNNTEQKILSIDVVGDGERMQHYVLGAIVTTKQGERRLQWDSFFNHENIPAQRKVYDNGSVYITFPSPVELVRGYDFSDPNLNNNFKVNLEVALKQFEPNNTILSVDTFVATGGNLDNIKLLDK